jgi:hypothetical protein
MVKESRGKNKYDISLPYDCNLLPNWVFHIVLNGSCSRSNDGFSCLLRKHLASSKDSLWGSNLCFISSGPWATSNEVAFLFIIGLIYSTVSPEQQDCLFVAIPDTYKGPLDDIREELMPPFGKTHCSALWDQAEPICGKRKGVSQTCGYFWLKMI